MATGKIELNGIKFEPLTLLGDKITVPVDASTIGIKTADKSELDNPPTKTGYTFVQWMCKSSSYRLVPIGVAGTNRLYYYVSATYTTALDINCYPLYRRDVQR